MEMYMPHQHEESQKKYIAEAAFCSKRAYQGLNNELSIKAGSIVYNDILQLVKGNQQPLFVAKIPEIMIGINNQLPLRRVYKSLVEKFKFAESGRLAAASTGDELPTRQTEQFVLKFKRDKSQPSQVFALLSIAHPNEYHYRDPIVAHVFQNDAVNCVHFPALLDGSSQLLLDDTDDKFKLLIDGRSLIYLM